jgi:hypothetical protein
MALRGSIVGLLLLIAPMAACVVEPPPEDDEQNLNEHIDGADGAGSAATAQGYGACMTHDECQQGTLCGFARGTCGAQGGQCAPVVGAAADGLGSSCDGSIPVCGCDGATYPNECEAWRFGVSVDFDGSCDGTVPPTTQPDPEPEPEPGSCGGVFCGGTEFCDFGDGSCGDLGPAGGLCRSPNAACTAPMATVCGCDGVSYDSACEALKAGSSVRHDGPC